MTSADDDPCYLSATEAIARFTDKSLSPVEVMRAVIARIEAINPILNAFTYTFFERALEKARAAAEKSYMSGDNVRPLEGVPILSSRICTRLPARSRR